MRNQSNWRPSKYVPAGASWRASTNADEVSAGSWLITDLLAERFARTLPNYCKGRVIDLGCGKVPLFGIYGSIATEVVCIDWGTSPHGNLHVDVFADLNRRLPLADLSCDTVILSDVLEHIYEPRRLVGELARVLQTGGTLILNVPFMYWLHEVPHDYHRYTCFCLERMLNEAGFEICEMSVIGGAIEVLGDVIGKLLMQVPAIGTFCARTLQRAVRMLGRTRPGTLMRTRSGARLPLGYLLVARKVAIGNGD